MTNVIDALEWALNELDRYMPRNFAPQFLSAEKLAKIEKFKAAKKILSNAKDVDVKIKSSVDAYEIPF